MTKNAIDEYRGEFRRFLVENIKPHVESYDRQERLPEQIIQKIAEQGYLGATIPTEYGGKGLDQLIYGLLLEEMGMVCSSCRSLLTVHVSLIAETIVRWGSREQKNYWLPLMASGKKISAFCLTESTAGSDAKAILASYEKAEDHYVISGTKKWITFGERADVFLFFARCHNDISAFLIDRHSEGVEVSPIKGMLGLKASLMAEVKLTGVRCPNSNLIGREGAGFFQIIQTALDNGRFSVAMGCLGIAKACLKDSVRYVKARHQFGNPLKDHQLIKQKIANMLVGVKTSQLMCYQAARLRMEGNPDAVIQTSMAKYHASRCAFQAATQCVQVHGALGCHDAESPNRYFRDSKIMEIIEGSNEIQELLLGDYATSTSLESLIN